MRPGQRPGMVNQKRLKELFRGLLGVKADRVLRDMSRREIILDVEQIVFSFGQPCLVVGFRGAHTALSPQPL